MAGRIQRTIQGRPVPAFGPQKVGEGISILVVGEAPGRLGADYSGLPFWGDRSGDVLWSFMRRKGYVDWEGDDQPSRWPDGDLLKKRPRIRQMALTNAFNQCPPADPGGKSKRITKPSRTQIKSPDQIERFQSELDSLKPRMVWTLGSNALFALSLHLADSGKKVVKEILSGGLLQHHGTLSPEMNLEKGGRSIRILCSSHCSPLVINSRFGGSSKKWLKKIEPCVEKLPKPVGPFTEPAAY